MAELDALRWRGLRLLVLGGWVWGMTLSAVLIPSGSTMTLAVIALVFANNLLPTLQIWRRQNTPAARAILALSYVVHPAIGVFVLQGQSWQMDAHLYFLVAIAALTILYDWRPIALAAFGIAAHHFSAFLLEPAWAFDGSTDFSRVAMHALAVLLQAMLLGTLALRSSSLIVDLASSRALSQSAADDANLARMTAESALVAVQQAELRANQERALRRSVEDDARAEHLAQLALVADDFEASVTGIVSTVSRSAQQLAKSADALQVLAHDTEEGASIVAAGAAQASSAASAVAQHVAQLSLAIADVVGGAVKQGKRNEAARDSAAAGRQSVLALTSRATQIGEFAQAIDSLSGTINLVAINAAIEAARQGDAGKGFVVVAGEVKVLANRAGTATHQIKGLTSAIHESASLAEVALDSVGEVIADVARSAIRLREDGEMQRVNSVEIQRNATELANCADHLAQGIKFVAGSADSTRLLSDEVKSAAGSLLTTAENLDASTRRFVALLRAS